MKSILVVDDELDIAEAVKAILEDEGYRIITCGNGREALKCIAEAKPDLVLMDIMMPVMNGLEAIKAIREQEELAKLPIVVMSAISPQGSGAEHRWAAFLKKPFSLEELLRVVQKFASKEPDQDSATE